MIQTIGGTEREGEASPFNDTFSEMNLERPGLPGFLASPIDDDHGVNEG